MYQVGKEYIWHGPTIVGLETNHSRVIVTELHLYETKSKKDYAMLSFTDFNGSTKEVQFYINEDTKDHLEEVGITRSITDHWKPIHPPYNCYYEEKEDNSDLIDDYDDYGDTYLGNTL